MVSEGMFLSQLLVTKQISVERLLHKLPLGLLSLAVPQQTPHMSRALYVVESTSSNTFFFGHFSSKQNLSHELSLNQKFPSFLSEGNGHFRTIIWALRILVATVLIAVSKHCHQSKGG